MPCWPGNFLVTLESFGVFWVESGKCWGLWLCLQMNKPWGRLVLIKPKEKLFKLKSHRRCPNSWHWDGSKNEIGPDTNALYSDYLTLYLAPSSADFFLIKIVSKSNHPPLFFFFFSPQNDRIARPVFSTGQNISFAVCHSLTVLLLGNSHLSANLLFVEKKKSARLYFQELL